MSKLSYMEAYNELEKIVEDIENAKVNIDELEGKIKRASDLINICKDKLFKTEQNVLKSLKDIKPHNLD